MLHIGIAEIEETIALFCKRVKGKANVDVAPTNHIVKVEGVMHLRQCLCNSGVVKGHNLIVGMGIEHLHTIDIVGGSQVNKHLPTRRRKSAVEVGLHLCRQRTHRGKCPVVCADLTAK